MRLLILILCLTYALCEAVPGQDKCVWGPTYWCHSVGQARECGATQHCLDTTWKYQIVSVESTATCTYCQLVVSAMKDALAKKSTEDEVAKVLADVCELFPAGDTRDICKGFVTEELPVLIQMLEKDISTDMICSALSLCSGLKDTWSPYGEKQTAQVTTSSTNNTCRDCITFFKDVQETITSKETESELEQLLNQTICNQLGAFGDTCNQLVKQYLPIFLEALASQLDPDIVCRVFGFCTATGSKFDTIPIKNVFLNRHNIQKGSSEECDICEDLFQQLVNTLRDKSIQAKVKESLENDVCPMLGGFAGQCKQIVEEYAPMLFELLVNELDPTTVCTTMGLCQGSQLPRVVAAASMTPAKVAGKVYEDPAAMVGPGYVKEGPACVVCKAVLQEVDNLLKQNETIQTIEDLVDKVCARFPTKVLTQQCEDFVKEYGELVLRLLAQELDPSAVCSAIGLCAAQKHAPVTSTPDDTACKLCMMGIKMAEDLVANVTEKELIADLNMVCDFLPNNFSAKCHSYVAAYGTLVISFLKSKESPRSLCTLAQLCKSEERAPTMVKPVPIAMAEKPVSVPSEVCEICDTIIVFLKSTLKENATEEEVKEAVESLCSYLPVYQSECKQFVDTYGDRVIQLLLQKLDAHAICMELGLCKETRPEHVSVPSEACEICDTIIIFLKSTLKENATEEEVKEAVESLCSYLPVFQSECKQFVDTYGDRVIQLLLQKLDAHAICMELGLCKESDDSSLTSVVRLLTGKHALSPVLSPLDTLPISLPSANVKPAPVNVQSVECEACKLVMNYLDKALEQNRTEENIKALLKEVCSKLPDTISVECTTLVARYTDLIINYLLLDLSPALICQKLSLCPAPSRPVLPTPVKTLPKPVHVKLLKDNSVSLHTMGKDKAGPLCVICEFVMKEVDDILQGNRSAQAVTDALEKVCSLLPDTISAECKSFVDSYAKVIINLLVQELANPDQVCALIKLCTSDAFEPLATRVQLLPSQPGKTGSGELCTPCKLVVTELKQFLKENRTTQEVEDFVKKLCDILPDTVTVQCHDVVDQYIPAILDLLRENMNPEQVCQAINLCPKPIVTSRNDEGTLFFEPRKPTRPLLGAKECTYGPAFWCASKENAIKCKAVEHCMNHVWN